MRGSVAPSDRTRTVAVLAFPGVQVLDVVGPLEVFGRTSRWLTDERRRPRPAYRAMVLGTCSGFGTAEALRRAFHRRMGVPPGEYRRRFGAEG